jgi:hypothetical protein
LDIVIRQKLEENHRFVKVGVQAEQVKQQHDTRAELRKKEEVDVTKI